MNADASRPPCQHYRGIMRRDKRPFVVEVKRGPKKDPAKKRTSVKSSARTLSADEPVLAPAPLREVEQVGAQTPRRILQSLEAHPETATSPVADEAPRRRGRKPGSKNKPKAPEVVAPRRRGRPPKNAGGQVRSVSPTQAVVSAALEAIARSAPAAPTGSRNMFPNEPASPDANRAAASAEQPVKRGRGRPRKIVPPGGFPPKIPEWISWSQSPDEAKTESPVDEAPAEQIVHYRPTAAAIAAFREPAARQRAGLRWTRRLRGIVALSQRRVRNA